MNKGLKFSDGKKVTRAISWKQLHCLYTLVMHGEDKPWLDVWNGDARVALSMANIKVTEASLAGWRTRDESNVYYASYMQWREKEAPSQLTRYLSMWNAVVRDNRSAQPRYVPGTKANLTPAQLARYVRTRGFDRAEWYFMLAFRLKYRAIGPATSSIRPRKTMPRAMCAAAEYGYNVYTTLERAYRYVRTKYDVIYTTRSMAKRGDYTASTNAQLRELLARKYSELQGNVRSTQCFLNSFIAHLFVERDIGLGDAVTLVNRSKKRRRADVEREPDYAALLVAE